MCRNFTYEVVGQRRKLKAIKKNCSSKNKCHFLNIFSEFYMKPVAVVKISVQLSITPCIHIQGDLRGIMSPTE
jgi:hypothetical protein